MPTDSAEKVADKCGCQRSPEKTIIHFPKSSHQLVEIYLEKEVVETVEDPSTQISIADAQKKSGDSLSAGEEFVEIVPLVDFGRRLVLHRAVWCSFP